MSEDINNEIHEEIKEDTVVEKTEDVVEQVEDIHDEIKMIKQSEVASFGKPIVEVKTKPYFAINLCLIVGVACIIYRKLWVLGVFMLVLAIFALWKVPNEKRVDFFEDFFIIYYPDQNELCQLIRHEDVEEWYIRNGTNTPDFFQLKLKGNQIVSVECFNSSKIVRRLNKVMPEREANKKKIDNMKISPINMNIKWPWRKD